MTLAWRSSNTVGARRAGISTSAQGVLGAAARSEAASASAAALTAPASPATSAAPVPGSLSGGGGGLATMESIVTAEAPRVSTLRASTQAKRHAQLWLV